MNERRTSSQVLSTTAQRLAKASSLALVRDCLQDCIEALFGRDAEAALIVGESDINPTSSGRALNIPLAGSNGNVGLIELRGVEANEENVDLMNGLAAQFAMVVQRLAPQQQSASVGRMRAQLDLGRQMQRLVLPNTLDAAFDVAAFYQPFFEVGGDFYEVVTTAPGKLTILIADASGKGVAAALFMMRLVGEFRVLAKYTEDPAAILEELNRSLTRSPAGDGFVTAVCASLSRFKSSISIANAGHVLPLLKRSGRVTTACEPSPPLGMLEAPGYVTELHLFEVGDMLLMMTDGFSEPFELDGAPGVTRIHERALEASDESSACELLREAWQGALEAAGKTAFDDATLVIVRHSGAG